MPRKKTTVPSSKPAAASSKASQRPEEQLDDATLMELIKILLGIHARINREERQE